MKKSFSYFFLLGGTLEIQFLASKRPPANYFEQQEFPEASNKLNYFPISTLHFITLPLKRDKQVIYFHCAVIYFPIYSRCMIHGRLGTSCGSHLKGAIIGRVKIIPFTDNRAPLYLLLSRDGFIG
jgi:hypothetical protein